MPLAQKRIVRAARQAGKPVGKHAVMDVPAAGVVAGQRRGMLPHFPAAAGVLVVAVAQRLAVGEPQALCKEQQKKAFAKMFS